MQAKVTECLTKLPQDSVDSLVTYLKNNNIKGKIADGSSCPLANFLRKCSGLALHVSPGYIKVRKDFDCHVSDCTAEAHKVSMGKTLLNTPHVLAIFISRFDSRAYPDLIEETEE